MKIATKKRTIFLGFVPALLMAVFSCGPKTEELAKPYRAEVLKYVPANPVGSGTWVISEQPMLLLEDLEELQSSYFKINLGGQFKITPQLGSLIDSFQISRSNNVKLRYTVKKGVIIPRDSNTLLALSAFHSFEQVFSSLADTTGLSSAELAAKIQGRYQVYFEPAVVDDGVEMITLTPKLNAAFDPRSNSFLFFKRSPLEKMALSADVKTAAHEFGHALFKSSFGKNDWETCTAPLNEELNNRLNDKFFKGRWDVEYSLSGLNEGYADFFSWITTAGVFTANDMGGFSGESRSLVGPQFTFFDLSNDAICPGRFYCLGTLFARALFSVAQKFSYGKSDLYAYSRRVYAALSASRENLNKEPAATILPAPDRDVAKCMRRDKLNPIYDGRVLSGLLSAFLISYPSGAEKNALCENLKILFGNAGFTTEAQRVCES